jgi:single-stranded DNA-binding protein
MSKRWNLLRRGDEKPNGGFYWEQTGFVLIGKRSEEGEARFYLKDQRTGELYSAFEQQSREERDKQQQQRQPKPEPEKTEEYDDDIPF